MPKIEDYLIGAPPRYPGKLLKTGQTTQYSSELDDGYYEKGLTKRYAILTTGQHSGACVFTLDGKVETQSHNCVRDLVTGLMWARYTSAESASVGASADGKMAWTGTDDDIFAYCAAANVAQLGGYSDWRVGNIYELFGLTKWNAGSALPNTTAFPGWSGSYYWASNNYPVVPAGNNVSMLYNTGYVGAIAGTTAYFVALVRGGV